MTGGPGDPRPPAEGEVAAGINALEGYLLARSEIDNARGEAEAFADRLPWLLGPQREEVVLHYTQARIAVSHGQMGLIAARCAQLREEYAARYRTLRRRLLGCHLVALAVLSAAAGMTLLDRLAPSP